MCGLLGIWDPDETSRLYQVGRLLSALSHRGPDESWSSSWQSLTIGCTRLAIVDVGRSLDAINPEGSEILVNLNGEIWNYRDLAETSPNVDGNSECEVIRSLYKQEDLKLSARLDGVFAICILDKRAKSLSHKGNRRGSSDVEMG